jgi:hypothetical protein
MERTVRLLEYSISYYDINEHHVASLLSPFFMSDSLLRSNVDISTMGTTITNRNYIHN